jgi:hypothetical protein
VLLKYKTSNDLCFIGNVGQYKIQIILYEIFNVHLCLARYATLNLTKNCALFLTKKFRDMIIIKLSIYCAYGECKNHVHFTMKNLINVGIVVTKIH